MLDGAGGRPSDLADLRGCAGRTGVRECLSQVERYCRLVVLSARRAGALEVDVSVLPPGRRRALEALGRRMTAQQLRRLEPARRHPVVLVLLHALVIERGDELLDLFQKLLRLSDGRARRRVDEQRRSTARQRNELADLGKRLSVILLECAAPGELPLDRVREEIGLERLHAAAALEPGELPPIDVQQFDQLRGSYNHLRRAVHAVLDAVVREFIASTSDDWTELAVDFTPTTAQVFVQLGFFGSPPERIDTDDWSLSEGDKDAGQPRVTGRPVGASSIRSPVGPFSLVPRLPRAFGSLARRCGHQAGRGRLTSIAVNAASMHTRRGPVTQR